LSGLRLAYNTNGLAHHRLEDAIDLLADEGYQGIGLTLDVGLLDPRTAGPGEVEAVGAHLDRRGLSCVVETGGRFILDPRRKHHPTLLSGEGSGLRVEFLERSVAIARDLGASVVSLWSGRADAGSNDEENLTLLTEHLRRLAETAAVAGVVLGFEPEPGMCIDTLARWTALKAAVDHPSLRLTLDVGHVLCEDDGDPAAAVLTHRDDLVNVQIEDMKRGIHEHLPFGEGDLDLDAVVAALLESGYVGLVGVELSRDSHRAPEMVRAAKEAIRTAEASARS